MAEIDDFVATLSDVPSRTNAIPTPADITANLAPVTSATTKRIFDTATPSLGLEHVAQAISPEARFKAENTRGDVPLLLRSSELPSGGEPPENSLAPGMEAFGLPPGLTSPLFRLQMARRKGLDQQLNYAKRQLGDENARLSKDGKEVIVTVPNPDDPEKKMDVTVNDRDMTLGDFTALAAHVPEFAGAVLGLAAVRTGKLSGVKGFMGFLKDIVGGAVGQEAAGGAAEAATRLEDLEVVNPGQLIQDRAKGVVVDTALGLGLGGLGMAGGAASKFFQAPFSASRTKLQTEGLAALSRIKNETGIDFSYTAGQSSGSAPVIMSEEYFRSTPAGQRVLEPIFEKQAANKNAIFDALSSGAGTDEEVGQALVGRLQGIRDVTEKGLETAKSNLEQGMETRVKGSLLKSAPVSPELTPVASGEKLRSEIVKQHGDVLKQNRANYTEAYEVEGATDPIVPTKGITDAIKEIKLPMRTVEKEVPNKLVTASGEQTSQTVTTREPVKEFLHPEVEQFLGTKLDPKMPIQEVVQMRDMLWDEVKRGEAVKGIPTKQLTQIARSMTDAIDKGISELPKGSQLGDKLKKANEFYKKDVLKFEEAGIADIFKDVKDAGYVESSTIIKRLTSDPDKYQRTIKLLDPTSEGAKTVRAFVRDDLLRRSAYDIEPGRMQASRFISNLRKLREDHPDIYNDVIGPRGDSMLEDATLMGVAQGDIAIADAQKALSGNQQRLNALSEMKKRVQDVDKAEGNQLLKSFSKGKLDFNTVNPETAVNGFLAAGTETEIRGFMDALRHDNPVMAKRVERKMTEKFLDNVGGSSATDETIEEFLSNKTVKAKYEAVLGSRQFSLMEDIAKMLGPVRYASGVAGGTGMLVKGSKIGQFVRQIFSFTNPTKEIYDIVSTRFLSLFITNPVFRSWVENTPRQLFPDLAKAVVMSEPFINALGEDIKDKSKLAETVVAIRNNFQLGKPTATPPPAVQSEADFLNTLKP